MSRRVKCSTRTEAQGWRVRDRPLDRNGTEGGNGNPGGRLDVIERHQKKKIKRSVFKGSAVLAVDLVCGRQPHSPESSSQTRGVYCQISISHQQPGLELLELPELLTVDA